MILCHSQEERGQKSEKREKNMDFYKLRTFPVIVLHCCYL